MTARLKETYDNTVFKALMEKFSYKNTMEVPKLEKVTINMGLGEAKDNAKNYGKRSRRACAYHGTETGCDKGKEVHRQL